MTQVNTFHCVQGSRSCSCIQTPCRCALQTSDIGWCFDHLQEFCYALSDCWRHISITCAITVTSAQQKLKNPSDLHLSRSSKFSWYLQLVAPYCTKQTYDINNSLLSRTNVLLYLLQVFFANARTEKGLQFLASR